MLLVDAYYVQRECQIQIQLGTLKMQKTKQIMLQNMKHENHTTQFDTKSYSVQNDKPKSAHNKPHEGHFCATLQNFIDRHIVD